MEQCEHYYSGSLYCKKCGEYMAQQKDSKLKETPEERIDQLTKFILGKPHGASLTLLNDALEEYLDLIWETEDGTDRFMNLIEYIPRNVREKLVFYRSFFKK